MSRLIDADDFRREIDKHWPFTKEEQCKHGIADMAKSELLYVLNQMPTIERKKGEWEERKVSSEKVIDEWQSARCSVCGKYHTTPYLYYFDNFNFCPNCGARMEI